jgi:REP element-mobilizing transposase RayT
VSYSDLNYHLVTATKERRPYIRPELLARLVKYIGGIVRNQGGKMIEANGPDDHLHIVASLDAKTAICHVMRDIKSNAAAWVHDTFPEMRDFGWQDGYSAFTVSHSQLDAVVDYVQGQQEHHRKMTFEEELTALLRRHEVDFDPKYLLS